MSSLGLLLHGMSSLISQNQICRFLPQDEMYFKDLNEEVSMKDFGFYR